VAFFPSVVSGPIDRAKLLVPQLEKPRVFDYSLAADGMRQILWGLSKKIIVADNCSYYSSTIFDHYSVYNGTTLILGAFLYTVQLYADFSGYSDMAIGFSKLIGFRITQNFNYPYFAQNIAEYWRKWHISLTSWLTDYIFTPLSIHFRDYGKWGIIISIVITFLVSGLWHGANWTFVAWGFLHGCYFIPLILSGTMNKKKKIAKDKLLPSPREALNILMTFSLVMFTFILFRSDSIRQAFEYFARIFSLRLFHIPEIRPYPMLGCIAVFFILEWFGRDREFALEVFGTKWPRPARWAFYYGLIICMLYFGGTETQFLYFKF
jgi:D-alanyl-lipoteichoic acid acyltransferase DltB (MBOAT superfamily)